MSNLLHKIEDKLSSKKHTTEPTTAQYDTATANSGISGSTHSDAHAGTHTGGLTGNTTTGSGFAPGTHTDTYSNTGSGITGGTAVGSGPGHHHTTTSAGTLVASHRGEAGDIGSRAHHVPGGTTVGQPIQHSDFVPGSHPAAQNPSSIPTAGGERVGSIPGGTYNSNVTHDNRSGMEKIKDKVVPSRTDRPDDPITGQNYGQNTTTSHHGTHGVAGSHGTSATPLAYDQGFNDRHTGPGVASTGAGLTGAPHTGPGAHLGGTHDQYGSGIVYDGTGTRHSKHSTAPAVSQVPGTSHTGQGSHLQQGGYGSNPAYGSGVNGVTDAYGTTPGTTTTHPKPSLMDKLNPKKDADHDGKAGLMD